MEVVLAGRWRLDGALPSPETVAAEFDAVSRRLTFDAAALEDWDSGLLTFLAGVLKACAARHIAADQAGLPEGVRRLLAMAGAVPEQKLPRRPAPARSLAARIGEAILELIRGAPAMLRFLGEITQSFLRLFAGRARLRAGDLWLEVEQVGPRALPIVSVISFLVGLILAYLGADQLKLVGAQIFIADLVAIGMVR
ncbi:MAG: ABC transporter permease, partial [Rhodocyclaceae bacterium]|nr:ABC transporter permease [Rhodocyclaceae bacterium]